MQVNNFTSSFLDHNGLIKLDYFITIAKDNDIILPKSEIDYLRDKLSSGGKINYEEVIKDLAIIAI